MCEAAGWKQNKLNNILLTDSLGAKSTPATYKWVSRVNSVTVSDLLFNAMSLIHDKQSISENNLFVDRSFIYPLVNVQLLFRSCHKNSDGNGNDKEM